MPKIWGIDRTATHYDRIVGPATDVTSLAQYTSIQQAINDSSPGDTILILNGAYAEALSITTNIYLVGQGRGTQVTGNFICSSNYSSISQLRIVGAMTFTSPSTGNFVHFCWQTGGLIQDLGTSNEIIIIEE
jgi:hypothetical protein